MTGNETRSAKNLKLRTKFFALMIILFVAALVATTIWTSYYEEHQMEQELAEKGQVLSQQMDAVWEFMTANQDRLQSSSYSETGTYQGLHCAIAGRSIGQLFTSQTEYVTRFVNFNPRNPEDTPDEFESDALTVFLENPNAKEYYGIADYDGQTMFRYLAPMSIEESCLECHGSPAGELDITGHAKEGWGIGDVGGAISLVIPVDLYTESLQNRIVDNVVIGLAILVVALVVMYIGVDKLVMRPLHAIGRGVARIQSGNFDIHLSGSESTKEMQDLATQFDEMSKKLDRLYNNLELQVADRTSRLEEANVELQRQQEQLARANRILEDENRHKTDFLSMISHELRTPLTSIIAFSEMLNREPPHDEKEREIRSEIEANSRSLLLMINDILEMSRIDAGRIQTNMEILELGDVLGLVYSMIKPLADQKNIDFSYEIASDVPLIEGDFEKLRHVLENLSGNAIKFTPEGGTVALRALYHAGKDEVVIQVADTGIGIAAEDQERIFERFIQAHEPTPGNQRSTGLGLPLAREYVAMHHGTISVESMVNAGSVFEITLPVTQHRWEDKQNETPDEEPSEGPGSAGLSMTAAEVSSNVSDKENNSECGKVAS